MPCNHRPTLGVFEGHYGFICRDCSRPIGCCVEHCQQWHDIDNLAVVNSFYMCAEGRQNLPECPACHQRTVCSQTVPLDGRNIQVCETCAYAMQRRCERCDRTFYSLTAFPTCPACSAATKHLKHVTHKLNPIDRTLGVEMEFISKLRFDRHQKWGVIKGDGSVRPESTDPVRDRPDFGEYRGVEFASYVLNGDQLHTGVQETCKSFLPHPHDSYVNKTCGLHVHISVAGISDLGLRRVRDWWVFYQPIFFSLVDPSRRGNSYCRHVPEVDANRGSVRYEALNIQAKNEHGTYEWRLHHGSIDPYEVIAWSELLLNFVHTHKDIPTEGVMKIARSLNMRNRLIMLFKQTRAGKVVRADIVARLAKFGKPVSNLRHFNNGVIDLRKGR